MLVAVGLFRGPGNARVRHVCYESDDLETGRSFLSSWLTTYPHEGFFYGHLSWHLSLCELLAGYFARASLLYWDAFALDRHSGGPQQKIADGAAYLWRSELAGQPRDADSWRTLHEYANGALPRPGSGVRRSTCRPGTGGHEGRHRPRGSRQANGSSGERGVLPVRLLSTRAGAWLRGVRARRLYRGDHGC
jgi:hypothetical protein